MKIFLYFWCIFCLHLVNYASPFEVKVDERLELTSIACRIAGYEEYVNNNIHTYTREIDDYFEPYSKHPLIEYLKTLKLTQEIAYDAITASAFLFTLTDGRVKINSEINLSEYVKYDPRWTVPSIKKYITLLNSFYQETDFAAFYAAHKSLYQKSCRTTSVLDSIKTDWFAEFYGRPVPKIVLYLSLCNGNNNYALPVLGNDVIRIVIGCNVLIDQTPQISESVLPTIIHEIAHYYTNPIALKYSSSMSDAMSKVYEYVSSPMEKIACGNSHIMAGEWLNELFATLYFKDKHGMLLYNVANDENMGFIWMNRAIQFMDNFYLDRELYPTIEEYMPQIVGFVNQLPEQMNKIVEEYNNRYPYVVNTYPANGSTISPDITEIRIAFSQPMFDSCGFNPIGDKLNFSPASIHWGQDKRTLIIPVKLVSNSNYGIELTRYAFIGENGHRLKVNYTLTFKTDHP